MLDFTFPFSVHRNLGLTGMWSKSLSIHFLCLSFCSWVIFFACCFNKQAFKKPWLITVKERKRYQAHFLFCFRSQDFHSFLSGLWSTDIKFSYFFFISQFDMFLSLQRRLYWWRLRNWHSVFCLTFFPWHNEHLFSTSATVSTDRHLIKQGL